jgi:hypothetical protein
MKDFDIDDWMRAGLWLERHPLLGREPDFWLEIDGERVTYDEAVKMLRARNKLIDEQEAGFGAGSSLYRGSGGRMLSKEDIRNLKHLKAIGKGGV